MTTSTAPAEVGQPPAGELPLGRGSLLRAELRRICARRFVRVLVVLGVGAFLAGCAIASTQYASPSPQVLAEAREQMAHQIAEDERFREECLGDPNRPEGVPEEEWCPPVSEANYDLDWFLDRPPFTYAGDLPAGAIGIAFATGAVLFLVGATYIGAEWSTRSIVALLFWQPRRLRVISVKIAVTALVAALLGVLAQAAWLGAGTLLAQLRGTEETLPSDYWSDLLGLQLRGVLLVVIVALLGFGIANLIRNTAAALGVGFVYFAVVETAVRVIRPGWQEWLLTDNAAALVLDGGHRVYVYEQGAVDAQGNFLDGSREIVLSNLHGGLVLGIVTAVVLAAGVLLFARRDLH